MKRWQKIRAGPSPPPHLDKMQQTSNFFFVKPSQRALKNKTALHLPYPWLSSSSSRVIRTCSTAFFMPSAQTLKCVLMFTSPTKAPSSSAGQDPLSYSWIVRQRDAFTWRQTILCRIQELSKISRQIWSDANFVQICPNLRSSVCLAPPSPSLRPLDTASLTWELPSCLSLRHNITIPL